MSLTPVAPLMRSPSLLDPDFSLSVRLRRIRFQPFLNDVRDSSTLRLS